MVFKGLSNKFVCYVILVFPFAVFLGQIIGVYADPKLEGVAQNSRGIEIRKYNNYVSLIKYTGINFKEMESLEVLKQERIGERIGI